MTGGLEELEELLDAGPGLGVRRLVRAGEGLEPLEVARVGCGVRGEGLDVRREVGRGVLVAGLGEELGVLAEDLEVFLRFFVRGRGRENGRETTGLTVSTTGSPGHGRAGGGDGLETAPVAHAEKPAGLATGWAWKCAARAFRKRALAGSALAR